MLSVDIHIGRCYDDLIRKQELSTLGKSSKRFKDAAVLQDNFYKPQLLRIHKETRRIMK